MPQDTQRHPLPPGFRWPDGVRAAALFSFEYGPTFNGDTQATYNAATNATNPDVIVD